jgi:hypothetical protein
MENDVDTDLADLLLDFRVMGQLLRARLSAEIAQSRATIDAIDAAIQASASMPGDPQVPQNAPIPERDPLKFMGTPEYRSSLLPLVLTVASRRSARRSRHL